MPRIRTIKPEFFQDEDLQDLERNHPELRPMLVFSGLFCQCDKQGIFEWKPRTLALHILPFLWRDTSGTQLEESLVCLWDNSQIERLCLGDKHYGYIPTFPKHQRITGKEGQEQPRHPQVAEMTPVSRAGHTGDTFETQPRSQEGKGKEGKGKDLSLTGESESATPEMLLEAWNTAAMNLPKARGLSVKRKTHARKRLTERSLEEWNALFRRINDTPFLCGTNDRGWKATFDWIVSGPDNALKVEEGKYDKANGSGRGRPAYGVEAADNLLRRLEEMDGTTPGAANPQAPCRALPGVASHRGDHG